MVIYRNNAGRKQPASTSDGRHASVQRHHAPATPSTQPRSLSETTFNDDTAGDIIYGAKAIALFLFGSDDTRTRRRVFNLWSHYRDRKEKAGFFKLKGALCLSKAQWRAFHGL